MLVYAKNADQAATRKAERSERRPGGHPQSRTVGTPTRRPPAKSDGRNADQAATRKVERSEVTASGYRNVDDDPLGPWAPSDSTLMGAHPARVYAIQTRSPVDCTTRGKAAVGATNAPR